MSHSVDPTRMDDLIDNPSPRCACMLVLDTSGSMSGTPISELNQGVQEFVRTVRDDEVASYSVEVGIITAGGMVREVLPFTTVTSIDLIAPFCASGNTPLGEATKLALQLLEARKIEYKSRGVAYYQPWMVIISDGEPTDSWQTIASAARLLSEQRKLVVLPVGVMSANLTILSQFSSKPAKLLAGLKFQEFFQWLSASMSRVSSSNSTSSSINLPSTDSWDTI